VPPRANSMPLLWHSMLQRWYINATLLFFLPPRGNSVPPFATFLNGGKIFAGCSGPLAPCGLPQAARGLCLYCLS